MSVPVEFQNNSVSQQNNSKKWFWIVGGIVLMIILFFFFGSCDGGTKGESKFAFGQRQVALINQNLERPSSDIRRRIENAHGTVTITSIKVSKFQVETMDGTDNAGRDGSNVSYLKIWITAHWDGIFHKNGHTVLYTEFDVQNKQLLQSKIVDTNAMVNIEDPKFWYKVGTCVGVLLL